jgi:mRNA-degrading endonuclease RelE of RelBE toxin-antitoxin system
MNKPVNVFLLDEARNEYDKLNEIAGKQAKEGKENTGEMQLLKSIKQKIELIKANPFYGDSIEKRKIPKCYNFSNLWRVELTGFWRMLYTIKGDQIEILCFVLDILDHRDYEKRFGYRH